MNILALGAHFDDVELGAGGTIIRHIKNGDRVILVVVADSAYDNYDGTAIRTREVAQMEGEEAAKIMGVTELVPLGMPTKSLAYGSDLIERINKIVDDYEVDFIYTHWDRDVHQDHSAVGRATLNAGRHVQNILMYRSNWYQTTSEFRGNYFVDISEHLEQKVRAVKAHANEYKKFGPGWVDFFVNENANEGKKIGTKFAEVFEVVKVLI